MKIIILAAGQGTRLRPLTNDKPKCMVEYKGTPLITTILETISECNIKEIAIVNGYKSDILESFVRNKKIQFYKNKDFKSSNMVYSLFCAKDFMDDDLIISYSDIIYKKQVLQSLIDSSYDISVVVDTKWEKLWKQRMNNPLDDLETLKLKNNRIIELGKKPTNYKDIEGQYIGLIKISKNIIQKVVKFYNNLPKNELYDNKDFENMYMTSFIQALINNSYEINPVFINGGWIEIDTLDDLKNYEKYNSFDY